VVLIAAPEHRIVLDGCANFRAIGALPTASGAAVRPARLFRTNALVAATSDDRRRLRALSIATVIDLRSHDEVAFADETVVAGARHHHLPLGDLLADGDAWERWNDPVYVADRYFDVCLTGGGSIAEVFAILTDPTAYPAVVQCSLGKDRTGIVVALLLRAVGVPLRHVVDEYAESRRGAASIVEALHAQLDDAHCRALEPYLPALLAADPMTMRRFLGRIDDEFDSVTGYLRHLDVVSAIPFLGAALVEPITR
jgi:protein-tyrosine phosphatase